MFEKKLVLQFVTPRPSGLFRDHAEWFEKCVEKYNEKGQESTTNLKKIEILEIGDEQITICLHSELELTKAPGRALAVLSQLLTKNEDEDDFDPFFRDNLFHKKLFKTSEVENDNRKHIEDSEVVKILLDYVQLPKSSISEGKKNAFKKIKKIVEEEVLPLRSGKEVK